MMPRSSADFRGFSRSAGYLTRNCRQSSLGKPVNASTSARAPSRCSATLGSLPAIGVDEPVVLGVHGGGVGLVIDRVQQGLDPRPGRLRGRGHQVRGVVGPASLPAGAGQGRADGLDQAAVRVGGDELDAGQAAGGQVPEERQPPGAVLRGGDLQAEDLPVPVARSPPPRAARGRSRRGRLRGPSAPARPRRRRYTGRRPAAGSGTPPPARPDPGPSR